MKKGIPHDRFSHLLKDKIPLLKQALAKDYDPENFQKSLSGLHASEIAYLIKYLSPSQREIFLTWIKTYFDPEIFLFLDDELKDELISLLSPTEILAILNLLESDDALSLLAALNPKEQEDVLKLMDDEQRQNFRHQLAYPENSAGRLMQREVLCFPQTWTIKQALESILACEKLPQYFHEIFIVDAKHHPVGIMTLTQLVKGTKTAMLKDMMSKELKPILVNSTEEEVSFNFRLYDLMSAPVVSQRGRLLGMITADDVLDVMERTKSEEILHMGGIAAPDFYQSVLKTTLSRVQWLFVTLANSILTCLVITIFQTTLKDEVGLTILMPIAAAMAGNSGIQSSTIVIRALATKELSSVNMQQTLFKELKVALINGTLFALILGFGVYGLNQLIHSEQSIFVSICALVCAVFFNMLWAGFAGFFLPLIILRLGYDPALSAGALLTTTTDILGYTIFLGLAKWMMNW